MVEPAQNTVSLLKVGVAGPVTKVTISVCDGALHIVPMPPQLRLPISGRRSWLAAVEVQVQGMVTSMYNSTEVVEQPVPQPVPTPIVCVVDPTVKLPVYVVPSLSALATAVVTVGSEQVMPGTSRLPLKVTLLYVYVLSNKALKVFHAVH